MKKGRDAKEVTAIVVILAKARTTQSKLGLLVTQAEQSIVVTTATQKKASFENYSMIRNSGRKGDGPNPKSC